MLMRVLASFFFLGFVFCLVCLVNNGLPWVWCGGLRVCGVPWWVIVCGFVLVCGVCACCLVV